MSRGERERLQDIADAIAVIRGHMKSANNNSAADRALLADALLFQFVVIGEAVKNLSSELRDGEPEIPWRDIAGLRDLITHEYFRIDLERVVAVVERDLDPLDVAIRRLLEAG